MHWNIFYLLECDSARSGTPAKLDDVSGYGTADSGSDKTPPYLPTTRLQQQETFATIPREVGTKDRSLSRGSGEVSVN